MFAKNPDLLFLAGDFLTQNFRLVGGSRSRSLIQQGRGLAPYQVFDSARARLGNEEGFP